MTLPTGTPTAMTPSPELVADLIELRHDLHRHPELGTELPRTQAVVLDRLKRLKGVEVSVGTRQTSVTAVIRSTAPKPEDGTPREVVLLRGDMDALPVQEDTGLEYASQWPGVMHACGHDVHTTALVGAAHLLHARRDELPCDVVLMFQPAEEASVGAQWMIEDGVLDAAGRRVDAAFALHVLSGFIPYGQFVMRPGPAMAGCEDVRVTITGMGGHGSSPHLTLDPVPVACEIVLALQTHVSRRYSGFEPIVLTVGRISAGASSVVIPETAEMDLSVRLFSQATQERIRTELPRLVQDIAAAHGMIAEVEFLPEYLPLVNDAAETSYAASVLADRFGSEAVVELAEPFGGSEDFAWVLDQVSGAYLCLGAGIPGHPEETNHSPKATFDDALIPAATEALALLAWRRGSATPPE